MQFTSLTHDLYARSSIRWVVEHKVLHTRCGHSYALHSTRQIHDHFLHELGISNPCEKVSIFVNHLVVVIAAVVSESPRSFAIRPHERTSVCRFAHTRMHTACMLDLRESKLPHVCSTLTDMCATSASAQPQRVLCVQKREWVGLRISTSPIIVKRHPNAPTLELPT